MADIFISYSHLDRKRCDAICDVLTREGYSVAVDHRCIETGAPFRDRLEQEIAQATVMIVLWSANSNKKQFVLDEADMANDEGKVLLPLIIDETPDGSVLGFGQLQTLRCRWNGETLAPESRERLLADVQRHVRPVGPPGPLVLEAAIQQLRKEVDSRLGNDYTVEERIGTGRMTIVFKAKHNVLERSVALKVAPLAGILLLPGFYAEFRAALEAAKTLSHANIQRIHDVKLLETIACVVFEYIEGETLAKCIARTHGKLPLERVKDVACDVTEALAYAHSHGIVHCRFSPNNVMIATEDARALVSDFGMPNVGSSPEGMAARALFIDARYWSPEQCLGDPASPQSDQYALGATLYEMLTGRPPFVGKSGYMIMKQHCEDVPQPITTFRPDCPASVEATVFKLLRKKPADRYLATRELLRELRDWPLPDPDRRRDRISATGPEARAAKTSLASFERCLGSDPLLLLHFYQRLKLDPSLAPHLERMNFDRQIEMLRRGIRNLLAYGLGDEDARRELERVAVGHRAFGLTDYQLRTFVNVLLTLALERDPRAVDAGEREVLRREWQRTIELGLRRFSELAGVTAAK